MERTMFDELLVSVQEMDGIAKGQKQAAWMTEFPRTRG